MYVVKLLVKFLSICKYIFTPFHMLNMSTAIALATKAALSITTIALKLIPTNATAMKIFQLVATVMKIHAIVITVRKSPAQRKPHLLVSEGVRDVNMPVVWLRRQ